MRKAASSLSHAVARRPRVARCLHPRLALRLQTQDTAARTKEASSRCRSTPAGHGGKAHADDRVARLLGHSGARVLLRRGEQGRSAGGGASQRAALVAGDAADARGCTDPAGLPHQRRLWPLDLSEILLSPEPRDPFAGGPSRHRDRLGLGRVDRRERRPPRGGHHRARLRRAAALAALPGGDGGAAG